MMQNVVIRQADLNDPQDAAAIVAIVNAYATEPQGGGQPLPEQVCRNIVPGLRETPGAFVLLACEAGAAVGAAVCFGGFSTFAGKPLINVHDLSVLAEHRGRGMGTQLLQAVEAHARAHGCSKVTLEVREANPRAERLYRQLGYGNPSGFATRFLDKPLSGAQ